MERETADSDTSLFVDWKPMFSARFCAPGTGKAQWIYYYHSDFVGLRVSAHSSRDVGKLLIDLERTLELIGRSRYRVRRTSDSFNKDTINLFHRILF